MNKSYVIIMPVRNEAKFLAGTVNSIASQTIKPAQLIIVDDGSTDDTGKIAEECAANYDWIEVLHRADRGFRSPGGGVIETFFDGFQRITAKDWGFVVKLDGDLSFDPDYFERCLARFEKDPKLGIGGGTICNMVNGTLVVEAPGDPVFHVRGATKIYKRECWDGIGGLIRQPGWDTVDEYHANMLGYTTYTFPELKLCHHRPAGGAQGTWKNWVKNGLANYVAGYHPLFMLCKCAKRALAKPYAVGAMGLLTGFFKGYVKGVPQVNNRDLIRFVRQQQMRKLFMRESLWDRKPAI
jgi:glycosyltransferase involved in cell wall biosynthesis